MKKLNKEQTATRDRLPELEELSERAAEILGALDSEPNC